MKNKRKMFRTTVQREYADNNILISLVAFVVTVIATRGFLELTGYPQIGNSVLHIAHALWGGLLLIIAVYLPLVYSNRWVVRVSALLSGIGIGLFIDEIGKFITQSNDYFFPPALSLIYGFVLLNILVYLFFRMPKSENPRDAIFHAVDLFKEAIDGSLDADEMLQLESHLTIANRSDREEIRFLANSISSYLHRRQKNFSTVEPGYLKRVSLWVNAWGQRLDHRLHRSIISGLLILWMVFVTGYIFILVQGGEIIEPQVLQWRIHLVAIQGIVGTLMIIAAIAWFTGKDEMGLKVSVSGILLSLVALQTLYFFLSQFSAITATLLQFLFLQVLLAYRRWHIKGRFR